jgi:hypothetical protein
MKRRRSAVRSFLRTLLFAAALAAAFIGAAPAARAQSGFTRIVDLQTVGGFTAFDSKIAVWYYRPTGRGFLLFEKAFHDGTKLSITTQIPHAETIALWWAAYYAAPWTAPETQARFLNTDLPSTRVTYMANWSQLVRADLAARSLPPVTDAMVALIERIWDLAERAAKSDLFRYHAAGGLAGIEETVVISQDGDITIDRSFGRGTGPVTHKEGRLGTADVNALKGLCASWWRLPDHFDWPPGVIVADGIDYSGTYSVWGYSKEITSKTAAREDPAYTAVIRKVQELRDRVP